MCYSAQVHAELKQFRRSTGSSMALRDFVKISWIDRGRDPLRKRPKVPRAMEIDLLTNGPDEVGSLIREWDALEMSELEQELFKQKKRVADAQRTLQVKVTKKAQDGVAPLSRTVEDLILKRWMGG